MGEEYSLTADYAARLADEADPLLRVLRAARSWRVAPTIFINQRTGPVYEYDGAGRMVRAIEWTFTDSEMALALEDYEAGLCPGGDHVLSETSKPEHAGAYQPDPAIRCHQCTAQLMVADVAGKEPYPGALMHSFSLNPELVELNRQPVPPLPAELA